MNNLNSNVIRVCYTVSLTDQNPQFRPESPNNLNNNCIHVILNFFCDQRLFILLDSAQRSGRALLLLALSRAKALREFSCASAVSCSPSASESSPAPASGVSCEPEAPGWL